MKSVKRRILVLGKLAIVVLGLCVLLFAQKEDEQMSLPDSGGERQVDELDKLLEEQEPQREETFGEQELIEEGYNPPQTIQVLIQNDGYQGYYHDEVSIGCGEEEHIFPKNNSSVGKKRYLGAWENATVHSVLRADGSPVYEGVVELYETPEGYVLVNTVDLETYVKGVLPGEMPSSYPSEALKAQAVCARTYAAYQIEERKKWQKDGEAPGHPVWCYADVDDSTAFQVYANRQRTKECDAAVDATAGEIRLLNNEPELMTYYSTSALNPMEEEAAWYRWEYENRQMSVKNLAARMTACGIAVQQPAKLKVYKILASEIREDGRVEKLAVHTNEGIYEVCGEYNIRRVLCDGVSEVVCSDGSGYVADRLVPSAFFTIETIQNKECVVGYKLSGGGFGHGDGLSQNGAKAYAERGYSYQDILNQYY